MERIGSYRKYEPGLFEKAFKKCKDETLCQMDVRKEFKLFERGRWYNAVDKLHSAISHFDTDEIKAFKKDFPDVVKALNEFATIEEVRKF